MARVIVVFATATLLAVAYFSGWFDPSVCADTGRGEMVVVANTSVDINVGTRLLAPAFVTSSPEIPAAGVSGELLWVQDVCADPVLGPVLDCTSSCPLRPHLNFDASKLWGKVLLVYNVLHSSDVRACVCGRNSLARSLAPSGIAALAIACEYHALASLPGGVRKGRWIDEHHGTAAHGGDIGIPMPYVGILQPDFMHLFPHRLLAYTECI